ncbi:uncharacterized protein LOC116257954 isoform X1 [Nymphaea colorata]|nr:uncharacterized protein LOC116257954 isoform X1 [Nymphaea colorata]
MDNFEKAVEAGLALTKRLYYGRDDRAAEMTAGQSKAELGGRKYFPTAPTVYAVISDPAIVDNPDQPSYQPHLHGRWDPPALIPMQMNRVELEVNCVLSSAVVEFRGSFRVHCVATNRKCDCRVVVPRSEKTSILGAEVDISGRSYSTELAPIEEAKSYMERVPKDEDMKFIQHQIFSFTIPQVQGGAVLSLRIRWLQHLSYSDSEFSISIPFTFLDYVIPSGKLLKEQIHLNVDFGTGKELICTRFSHPLKKTGHEMGKLRLSYEAEVERWSNSDFNFSYMVSSDDVFGGLLVQPPHPDDFDKRNIFCLYILPASNLHAKVFRREVIFLIDTSASIQGLPLEESKNAVSAALMNLRPTDSFSIMSFNEEIFSFSSSLVPATEEKIEEAHQWLSETCHATGGTSILLPLNEAMKMFSKSLSSVPQIFLITDGSVKDEKNICHVVQNHIRSMGLNSPRISTFGIGLYCNHYFLRLLAQIGRGHYDAAYKTGTITLQMKRFFNATSSPLLTNVSIDTLGHLDSLEVSTTLLPDVSVGCPLIIMGRCNESFPNSHKVTGSLADGRELVINLKAQKTKGLLIDKVMAKQQIDILTASAWFSGSNELVDQVTTISMQSSIPCEFTQMTLLQASEKKTSVTQGKEVHFPKSKHVKPCLVHGLHVGFGNVMATDKNILILSDEAHGSTDSGKGVNCCNMSVFGDCTCTCCGPDVGSTFAHSWNDCTIAVTQYCAAFACLGCFSLCSNLCGN